MSGDASGGAGRTAGRGRKDASWRGANGPHRRRRHRAGLQLHQRLPRRGERHRHLGVHPGAHPAGALAMAAVMNLVGAFLGTGVAKTVGSGIIDPPKDLHGLTIVAAALIGAIVWNLITWYFGLPSSSTHGLVGGADRRRARRPRAACCGSTVLEKVVLWMVLSPVDRADPRLPRDGRHPVDLPALAPGPGRPPLPHRPVAVRGGDGARARPAGRAEDHGHHRARPGHHRPPGRRRLPRPGLGHPRAAPRCCPSAPTPVAGGSCGRSAAR